MSNAVFDVLVAAARHLDGREGFVAAGSTTTVVNDTTWGLRTQPADIWKGGTYFQRSFSSAIQRAIRVVASTTAGTITLATALPEAPTVDDQYVLLGNAYPIGVLIQKLNEFLQEYAESVVQNSSLLTVADQREYTIPAGSNTVYRVLKVEVQSKTDQYRYEQALGVEIDDARSKLVFPYPQDAGLIIRLTLSSSFHTEFKLSQPIVSIPEHIHPTWAAYEVAARAARWRLLQSGEDAQKDSVRAQDLIERAAKARAIYKPSVPHRQPRLAYTEVR